MEKRKEGLTQSHSANRVTHPKSDNFSHSALSLFRFHLSPFSPETPDTQASNSLRGRRKKGRGRGGEKSAKAGK